MQRFPILRTKIKHLKLVPLSPKHKEFYTLLLNEPSIQKTLFRTPRIVTESAFIKAFNRMYGKPDELFSKIEQTKAITYILVTTDNKTKTQKPFGYIKLNLFDWINKSCYLALATLPNKEFRGKGYATEALLSAFKYLESLGIWKVYARTYEINTATINLNERVGFRFIGRQNKFVLKKENLSIDAFFYERLSEKFSDSYSKAVDFSLQKLYFALRDYELSYKSVIDLEKPKNAKYELKIWFERQGNYVPKFTYDTQAIKKGIKARKKLVVTIKTHLSEANSIPPHWNSYFENLITEISNEMKILSKLPQISKAKSPLKSRKDSIINLEAEFNKLISNSIFDTHSPFGSKKDSEKLRKILILGKNHLSVQKYAFFITKRLFQLARKTNGYKLNPILSLEITASQESINSALSELFHNSMSNSALQKFPLLGQWITKYKSVELYEKIKSASFNKEESVTIALDKFSEMISGFTNSKFIISHHHSSLQTQLRYLRNYYLNNSKVNLFIKGTFTPSDIKPLETITWDKSIPISFEQILLTASRIITSIPKI